MTLALGLAATFIGAACVIGGVTNRPISRLLFGYWDAPGSAASASAPAASKTSKKGATADTGGTYAPSSNAGLIAAIQAAGGTPAGGPR